MDSPKKLWIVRYETKYGVEVYPAIVKKKLPELTNRLLKKIGAGSPELEKRDEVAEWLGPYVLKDLPKVIGPREWRPGADLAVAVLMVYSQRLENIAIIPAWVLAKVEAPKLTQELVEDLDPFLEGESIDFEKTEWIGPERIEELPVV